MSERLERELAERIAVETALRNELASLRNPVVVRCPKCGYEHQEPGAITQFDCLGCGSRIVSEERARPKLTSVFSANKPENG